MKNSFKGHKNQVIKIRLFDIQLWTLELVVVGIGVLFLTYSHCENNPAKQWKHVFKVIWCIENKLKQVIRKKYKALSNEHSLL